MRVSPAIISGGVIPAMSGHSGLPLVFCTTHPNIGEWQSLPRRIPDCSTMALVSIGMRLTTRSSKPGFAGSLPPAFAIWSLILLLIGCCQARSLSLIVRATAPVAAVDGQVVSPDSDVVRGIIWVWMADAVWTDSFHHALVIAPVQRPRSHVVIRRVVDAAVFSAALRFVVRSEECVSHNVALTSRCSE